MNESALVTHVIYIRGDQSMNNKLPEHAEHTVRIGCFQFA